jgi:hypothetical protein
MISSVPDPESAHRAMGGQGHPIDNAITAFISAVGSVIVDIPGLRLPLP